MTAFTRLFSEWFLLNSIELKYNSFNVIKPQIQFLIMIKTEKSL